MSKPISEQLNAFGTTLHNLLNELSNHDAITDTFDYVLGALYGLERAHGIGYQDRTGKHLPIYRPLLSNYALRIPRSEKLDSLWSAGFYFNSAVQRLAAAYDRIPKMLGSKKATAKTRMADVSSQVCPHWERVYDEVNAFKHQPEGKAAGRSVLMSDAISAFDEMLTLILTQKSELQKRY